MKQINNVFDFVNAISNTKIRAINENNEKLYIPFIVNKHFSFFVDTLYIANEMNRYNQLSNQMQYDFYNSEVRKRKRFYKWPKKNNNTYKILNEQGYDNKTIDQMIYVLGQQQVDTFVQSIEENKKVKNNE